MLADLLVVLGGALAILLVAEVVIRLTLRLARHYGLSGSFVEDHKCNEEKQIKNICFSSGSLGKQKD